MITVAKPVTAEELLTTRNSSLLELVEGELHTVSPANARHGNIAVEIAMLIQQFVKPRKLGVVLVECGYILARNPDTVLGPDVSFLRQARIPPQGLPEKFLDGAPDLAVEIISPSNPRAELMRKLEMYLARGTQLAWLVDPTTQTVEVHRPNQSVIKLTRNDSISGYDLFPGFSVRVLEFFS